VEELVSENVLCMVRELWVGNLTLLHSSPESPHYIMAKAYTLGFGDQYTKLNIWTFNQLGIESLVYLDTDMLILWNFKELFELGSLLLWFWMDEQKIVHYTLHKPFSRTVEGVSTREEEASGIWGLLGFSRRSL